MSQAITKAVTWHPGGAQIDPETGEAYPWPWGEGSKSPRIQIVFDDESEGTRTLIKMFWADVFWYCNPKDLDPPPING